MDFSASYYYGPFGTIVPYPKAKFDFTAPLKPLTYEVRNILHAYRFQWQAFALKNRQKFINSISLFKNHPIMKLVDFAGFLAKIC